MTAKNTLPQTSKEMNEALLSAVAESYDLREIAALATEAVLNELMSLQADELCNAEYNTPSTDRANYRNGYRTRGLKTLIGGIELKIPKLRQGSYFPEDVISRYNRSDRALVAAVAEMYLTGVSTAKVQKVAATMGIESLSASQVSRICAVLDEEVQAFRTRTFDGLRFAYLWLDATYIKCRKNNRVGSQAVVTAIAVGDDGIRRFVGFTCADTESYPDWKEFLQDLKIRGVTGVRLVISDAHAGLVQAIEEVYQGSGWQRCIVHLERNVIKAISSKKDKGKAARLLSAVFAEEDPAMVRALYQAAITEIEKLSASAARIMEDAEPDALAYLTYPKAHQKKVRTNNVQERENREIKRRGKVVQVFPSVESLIRLVGSVLAERDEDWSTRCYMSPDSLAELWEEPVIAEAQMVMDDEEVREKVATIITLALDARRKAA